MGETGVLPKASGEEMEPCWPGLSRLGKPGKHGVKTVTQLIEGGEQSLGPPNEENQGGNDGYN